MFPEPIERLIQHFSRLPSIGRKSAQRLAFYIVKLDPAAAEAFANALLDTKAGVRECRQCHNISDAELCGICADPRRDLSRLLVVADFADVYAIEKTNEYRGYYHVLGGILSPLEGIGPSNLNLDSLDQRVADPALEELILALAPNADGEVTTNFLMQRYADRNLEITRIARGVPIGSQLEYIDQVTLGRAISSRNKS